AQPPPPPARSPPRPDRRSPSPRSSASPTSVIPRRRHSCHPERSVAQRCAIGGRRAKREGYRRTLPFRRSRQAGRSGFRAVILALTPYAIRIGMTAQTAIVAGLIGGALAVLYGIAL